MQISIGFSGPAGSGVNTAGILLADTLGKKGYTVFCDKEYASVIKGNNNSFFLYISDQDETFISNTINYFFAYDQLAIDKNSSIYTLEHTFLIKDEKCRYKNTFTFGAALKILGIPFDEGKEILNHQFNKKELHSDIIDQNVNDLQLGYNYIEEEWGDSIPYFNLDSNIGEKKELMFGNELIAKGAINSGLEFYSAYPMTPASSIIDEVIKNDNVIFFQGEDEIAVSMAMLGAKYAGKRAMCGSSGGGFALMSESLSFSNQAEIGGVYVLSQRDGPSTGTPTFTGQGDLNYALNASFGDTKPIVFAPSTFQECYLFVGKALNWSDIYQHPIIMLVDKQLSESYLTISSETLLAEPILRGEKSESSENDNYKRYKITDSGISPYSFPGEDNTSFIATSYEHDEYGATNEEPIMKKGMVEKRSRKLVTFLREFNDNFFGFEIINPNAKVFYITMGINRYAIQSSIKNDKDKGLIIIKSFFPFDPRLKIFLDNHKDNISSLIFVEMNQSGILESLVQKECELYGEWKEKISHQRKYNLYPIFKEEIENNLLD